MKYYLTITAKRKNAKRHIISNGFEKTFNTIEEAEKMAKNLNKDCYKIEIYATKWDFIKEI